MNSCARSLYAYEINAHTDLPANWIGWRLRGKVLISPDGDRITPARLRGLLFVEANRKAVSVGMQQSNVRAFTGRPLPEPLQQAEGRGDGERAADPE